MSTELQPTPAPRRAWWPWVLGVVVVLGGLWLVTHRAGTSDKTGRGARPTKPVPVLVGDVKRADVALKLESVGTVEASESVSVRAQTTGQIRSVGFRPGQTVKKGQVLFVLDDASLRASLQQANATLMRDQAQLAQARSDATRFHSLASSGYVSRQQAEQAQASARALAATVAADSASVQAAKVQLAFATVRAPISGVAGNRLVDAGNLVGGGGDSPLVVINQVTPAIVSFAVPQAEIGQVRRFQTQQSLKVVATPRGGSAHAGTLTFLDNAIDTTTGTLRLRATFPNADKGLLPGQFADVVLTLVIEKGRVVAPAQAILPAQSGHLAFVLRADDTVEQRVIKLDRMEGEQAVIQAGLKPGERVVTDGTLQLRDGAKVEVRTSLVPPSPSPGGGGKGRRTRS